MLLTGVFIFAMFEGGMCLVLFFLFWCRTIFADFTATEMKNVIAINEARLVWPRSPNNASFTGFFFLTNHKSMFLQTFRVIKTQIL